MSPYRYLASICVLALAAGCSSAEEDDTSAASPVVVVKSKASLERPIMLLDLEAKKTVCVSTCKVVDLGEANAEGMYAETGAEDAFAKLTAACMPTGSVSVERAKKLLKEGFNADAEHIADEALWTSRSTSDDIYGDWLALVEGSNPCKSNLADMLSTRDQLVERIATLEAELAKFRADAEAARASKAAEAAAGAEAAEEERKAQLNAEIVRRNAAERDRQARLRDYAKSRSLFSSRSSEGTKWDKGDGK